MLNLDFWKAVQYFKLFVDIFKMQNYGTLFCLKLGVQTFQKHKEKIKEITRNTIKRTTLQRQNTEISKQIFPEKEYRSLSPKIHIHASVCDLYIPTIGLPFLLEEICRPLLGVYKSLTDTWMWKLGLRLRYSQKRNT